MSVCVFPILRKPRFSEEYSDKIRNQIIPISSSFLPFKAKSFVLSVQEKPYRIHSFIPPSPLPTETKEMLNDRNILFWTGYKNKSSLPLP